MSDITMMCVANATSLKIVVDNKFNECTELSGTYYVLSEETYNKLVKDQIDALEAKPV